MYPHNEFGIPTSNNMGYAPDIILLELNLEVKVTVIQKKYATLRDTKVHAHSIGYAPVDRRTHTHAHTDKKLYAPKVNLGGIKLYAPKVS